MAGTALPFSFNRLSRVFGAPYSIVRPNNVVAYVTGNVFGAAADARIAQVVPNLPDNAIDRSGFRIIGWIINQHRGHASPALPGMWFYVFTSAPDTILGDQAMFSLLASDYPRLQRDGNTVAAGLNAIATGIGQHTMTQGLDGVGIRGCQGSLTLSYAPSIVPGSTIWFYFVMSGAYVPMALDTIDMVPWYSYSYGTG